MTLTISDAGIDVQIVRETRSPTQQGFGSLLFINPLAAVTERIKAYTSLAGVALDYDSDSEAYKAALSYFSQSPSPIDFLVGQVVGLQAEVPAVAASGTLQTTGLATDAANAVFDIGLVSYTVTGVIQNVLGVAADGLFNLTGLPNAAGDGSVGFTIDAVPYTLNPVAADTAIVTAEALKDLVNLGSTHTAVADGAGLITITNVNLGIAGNSVVIVDTSTDTGTTLPTVTAPTGGVDAVAGTTGEQLAALMATQIDGGATHTTSVVGDIITITDVVAGIAGNNVVFAWVSGPAGITPAVVQPTGGAELIASTPGEDLSDALDNMLTLNSSFYCVALASSQYDIAGDNTDVAAWAEANERLFFAVTLDALTLVAADLTCLAAVFKTAGYQRTMVTYSQDLDGYISCSAFAVLATTSFRGTDTVKTLKFKDMPGVDVEAITPNELASIKEKNCNVLYSTAGIRMFDQGITSGGGWIDELHGLDALAEEIRVRVFGVLSRTSTKVPYNERGMALLEGEVEGALGQYVTNGYLTERVDTNGDILPAYTVWHVPVIDAPLADKSARIAPDIQFTARLASAIHEVLVNGVLTLD